MQPAPSTWTQIKAVGDVTGDRYQDLFLRAGNSFWALTGYTGGSFQQAVELDTAGWSTRDIINVADMDLDGTPDLLWRDVNSGVVSVRHGRPGAVAGSATLDSLAKAANSRNGDVTVGTGFTQAAATAMVGIPDTSGDRIPDLWVRAGANGWLRVYHPSTTALGNPVQDVIWADWSGMKAFG